MSLRGAPLLPLRRNLQLGRRAIVAYLVFVIGGILSMITTILALDGGSLDSEELVMVVGFLLVASLGSAGGLLASLRRLRVLPTALVAAIAFTALMSVADDLSEEVLVGLWIGLFSFCCGYLALQRTGELYASFPGAVGWVGSMIVILNDAHRVTVWEESKLAVWMFVPLVLLGVFSALLFWFLAEKHRYQLLLWRVAGGTEPVMRGRETRGTRPPIGATLGSLGALLLLVFVFNALLSPYLWRTGRGRSGDGPVTMEETESSPSTRMRTPTPEQVLRRVRQIARETASWLPWILLFVLLYRPSVRAARIAQLRSPWAPRSRSRRVHDQWAYLQLAVDDLPRGPGPPPSMREVVELVGERVQDDVAIAQLAAAYDRARFGVAIEPDDPERAHAAAGVLYRAMQQRLTWWQRVRAWYRALPPRD